MSVENGLQSGLPGTAISVLAALDSGAISAAELVEELLARIGDGEGEGSRAFFLVDEKEARKAAMEADRARHDGAAGPLAGLPVAVKDLFDIKGQITSAGSKVLSAAKPAVADAVAVARLRAAGAIILGRSHMNEFAFSALGINPHFPQPRAPWQREVDQGQGRAPGGSTSGGAVAVADLLAYAALGSDTGGSTRIPAAFCNVVGWRPSQGRIPVDGAFPLAPRFDTPGLITRSVADCRLLDSVLSGDSSEAPLPTLGMLRFGIASGMPFGELDSTVEHSVQEVVWRLKSSKAECAELNLFDWAEPAAALRAGQVTAVEALASHAALFDHAERYDPRVAARMRLGQNVKATEYVMAVSRIMATRNAFDRTTQGFDAVLMPTVSMVPPRLAELRDDDMFFAQNAAALRNTLIASILDLPAVSIPITPQNAPPAALMLIGRRGEDKKILDIAEAVENMISNVT